ncbi:AAA family ATPase [Peribacillus sp. NPDC097895]|uniref:AAA family ATPase n=1 Tax=Peribacillus sp. NPDC097895 TaxID=3390619 RepID=UPI003D0921F8
MMLHTNTNIYDVIISNIQKFKNIPDEERLEISFDTSDFKDEIKKLERKVLLYKEKISTGNQNKSAQYMQALNDIFHQVNSSLASVDLSNLISIMDTIKSCNSKFNIIEILDKLAETKNNIVIIGANGSGKSSFVSSLLNSSISNMIVIPAQKSLFYFPDASNNTLYKTSIKDVENYQRKDFISFSKGDMQGYTLRQEYLENFPVLVTALTNDYIQHGMKIAEQDKDALPKDKITFNKLRQIWGILLPHIDLKIDSTSRTIYPVVDGNQYNINSLSDGEKCIFYYIGNILLAPSNSYIIVDEPETFLNPSIYNKLWDLLSKYREDCQFIFCSHTVDFITSRINSTLVWSKKFSFPNNWDIEYVPHNTSLPTSILAELLGSRKRVLFCEGDDKNSIDFKIYSSIFLENYTIIPAGGHTKVIQYVKAFNELNSLHNNKAVGIIDGDLLTNEIIHKYKEENIFTLPFNEIEILLFSEEVMESYLKDVLGQITADEKIQKFKAEFYKSIKRNKEKIIVAKIKKIIDSKLENYRIQNTNSLEELTNEYKNLNTLVNVHEEYTNISSEIDKYLEENRYKELLNLCNLKEEVSKGLANKLLDSNYVEKAVYKISSNKTLNKFLKESYFNEILIQN